MYGLYRVLTWAAWAFALPWLIWKRSHGGREWRERLGELPGCPGGVWVHAASVGEVVAASPLVRALLDSGERVMLTVVTPTGRRSAGNLAEAGAVVAFPPLDLPASVGRALGDVSARALLIVETELWPGIVVEAAARGMRVAVVNGRLSRASARRYRTSLFPLGRVRDAVSLVICRSEEDRRRFLELGFEPARLAVSGSMKHDSLSGPPDASERAALRESLSIERGSPVVVFGSVRPDEEESVVGVVESLLNDTGAHVVVAPRHLDRTAPLSRRLAARGLRHVVRSEGGGAGPVGARVTLLDTTGELVRMYSVADVAFVGGTLAPYGGHNPLEPAALGVPVVVGPHTTSCAEDAALLVERGAAVRVGNGEELLEVLTRLLADDEARAEMRARAREAVDSGRGATARTLDLLKSHGVLAPAASEEE